MNLNPEWDAFLSARRRLIVKCQAEGMSFQEIADFVSCPASQVQAIWYARHVPASVEELEALSHDARAALLKAAEAFA